MSKILTSGGLVPTTKDTLLDARTRVATFADIANIENPARFMVITVEDTGKKYEVRKLSSKIIGGIVVENSTIDIADTEALVDLGLAEELRSEDEKIRQSNESKRIEAENLRKSAEDSRKSNENSRISSENARVESERTRVSSEETRNANEQTRNSNETKRQSKESTRQSQESARQNNESVRNTNESARKEAESERKTEETSRRTAELSRKDAENIRVKNEQNRTTAENTRSSAEDRRVVNETQRTTNETARNNAELSRAQAEGNRASTFETLKGQMQTTIQEGQTAVAATEKATSDAQKVVDNYDEKVAEQDGKLSELGSEVNDFKKTITNQVNNYKPIEITGDVTNAADEEDITSDENNLLKLKDRNNLNGMGYAILRKNKTFAEQLTQANTIYEIRYDFDLNKEEFTFPENCIIKFNGGSIFNGVINANNCTIEGKPNINNCSVKGEFLNYSRERETVLSELPGVLTISSQSQLEDVLSKVENGVNIEATLLKGYYTLNRTYNLKGDLRLNGSTGTYISTLTDKYRRGEAVSVDSAHYKCVLKNLIPDFSLFVCGQDIINISEDCDYPNMVNSTTEKIVDYNGSTFKLPITDNLKEYSNKEFVNVFGWLDSLWDTIQFRVDSSDNDYFYCTQTSRSNVTNLNGDIDTYEDTLNYVLYNLSKKEGRIYYDSEYIYIPISYDSIDVVRKEENPLLNTSGKLTINNISFINCALGVQASNSRESVNITECLFKNILFDAIKIVGDISSSGKKVNIDSCRFENCAIADSNIISVSGKTDSENSLVNINNCDISQYTDGFTNYKNASVGLYCHYGVEITGCNIYNCVRGGLFLSGGNIKVKNCKLYNTNKFNSIKTRNYSRDLGMIYCNHLFKNDEEALNNIYNTILIEECRIYNFSGKGDTRGIFIDDGRGDVSCVKNVIDGNESYSIDSRNITKFSDGTIYTMSSIRNRFEENLCMTPYRLRYGSGVTESNMPYSKNYVMCNIVNDVDVSDDIILDSNTFSSKDEFIISYLENKDTLNDLPFVIYQQSSTLQQDVACYGNKPIIHLSFIFNNYMEKKPVKIIINNTLGINTEINLMFIAGQFGCSVNIKGKYIAGRCNVYKSGDIIDIYLAFCDEAKIISRHYGIIEWSHAGTPLNVEFLDSYDFPETNLHNRYQNVNYEYVPYNKPTIDNNKFVSIMSKGNIVYTNNELYARSGVWFTVTRNGLFNTRGGSTDRPSLSTSVYDVGYRYYDNTLNKPIWWSGTAWVDATGAAV